MTESFFHIVTNRMNTVLALGFAYGATIVFTFFGPALMRNSNEAGALALVAVICHVLAFYLPPLRPGAHPGYFPALYAALLPLLLCFPRLSLPFQTICVGGYAWMVGRIGCFWTYKVIDTIAVDYRGRTICCALFVSFSLLYIVNLIQPMLPAASLMGAPAVMSGLSVFFFRKMQAEMICPSMPGPKKKRPAAIWLFWDFYWWCIFPAVFPMPVSIRVFSPTLILIGFTTCFFSLSGCLPQGRFWIFGGEKLPSASGWRSWALHLPSLCSPQAWPPIFSHRHFSRQDGPLSTPLAGVSPGTWRSGTKSPPFFHGYLGHASGGSRRGCIVRDDDFFIL